MSVLVDTSIWSLAFRRRTVTGPEVQRLANLITRGDAVIIGPVRQEVLSGIRTSEQFLRVRQRLRAFPDHSVSEAHFEHAADFYNRCRARGVQGSNTDFLICAVAEMDQMPIFTADIDFQHFAKHLPIRLLG